MNKNTNSQPSPNASSKNSNRPTITRTSIIKKLVVEWWGNLVIFSLSVSAIVLVALVIILGFYYFDSSEPALMVSTTTLVTRVTGRLANQTKCGKSLSISNELRYRKRRDLHISGRIMNGRDAVTNSWPWIVSIRTFRNGRVGTHFCAGSLIYSQIVLTAAHCVDKYDFKNLAVIAGVNGLDDSIESKNIYRIKGVILHPSYDRQKILNDIAVIKLDREIEDSSRISTVCLPFSTQDSYDIIDKDVILTGWGSINGKDTKTELAQNLQQAILKVTDPDDTGICYNSNTFDKSIVYCAHDKDGKHDSNACFGDSGGPLIYNKQNKWHIYGIVSYILTDSNVKSCDPSLPSYHTQVPKYLEFIGNAIANLNLN